MVSVNDFMLRYRFTGHMGKARIRATRNLLTLRNLYKGSRDRLDKTEVKNMNFLTMPGMLQ